MKEFKKPDVKAPRFRVKGVGLLNRVFYKSFRLKHPEHKITDKEINDIVREYNIQLWNGAIEYRDGIELPQRLGNMFVGTCDSPRIRYNSDFGSSIKDNMLTRLKNYDSSNFLAKIFYTNCVSKYKFAFRELWEFKGTRDFTRTVAKTYPEQWKKYIVVENTMLISKLYKKAQNKNYGRDLPTIISDDYNEFNLD